MRGMKTLAVRLDRQQENALRIARFLQGHPAVDRVHYPGLPEHPGADVHSRQADGAGAMVSFSVREAATVERVLEKVRVISFAESLGGVESLITFPAVQTHADVPEEIRERLGVTDRLMRLSVGIEAADDLIADLEQALR
jgi:cystathionine beta-lyase/cystathionine gamma-synthase